MTAGERAEVESYLRAVADGWGDGQGLPAAVRALLSAHDAKLEALTAAEQQVAELRGEVERYAGMDAEVERLRAIADSERAANFRMRQEVEQARRAQRESEAARDAAREETARVREALEKAEGLVRDYAVSWEQSSLLGEDSDEDEWAANQEACSATHAALMKYAENRLWGEDGLPCSAALTPTPPQPAARTEEG